MDALEVGGVAVDHPQQIVVLAGEEIAFGDFRDRPHRRLELFQRRPPLAVERHRNIGGAGHAGDARVEDGDDAGDEAAFLEEPGAPQAGRRRQMDTIGEFRVGAPGAILQRHQDGTIGCVEPHA